LINIDVDPTIAIHVQASEKDLEQSLNVVYFDLRANNEGYWTYIYMASQFEDCVDCLRAIFAQGAFTFLFDHSQEHANKLTNVLNGKYSMIHGFGGV
jgi:hypothetical protein